MKEIEIYLPWPPTVNSYYGHKLTRKQVITYVKKKGVDYRNAVEAEVVEQVGYLELDEPILLEVILYPPDARKRDLDNYMKALLDACTHAKLWEDDSLIDQLHIYRGRKKLQGLVTLRLNLAGPIMP